MLFHAKYLAKPRKMRRSQIPYATLDQLVLFHSSDGQNTGVGTVSLFDAALFCEAAQIEGYHHLVGQPHYLI